MKLELLLKGKDQLSAILKKQSPLLRQLDRDAIKTFNSLKKLFDLKPKSGGGNFSKQFASDIRKSNSEAAKLKKTLESIGNIKIKSPKIGASSVSSGVDFKQSQKELDKLYNPKQRPRNAVERLARFNDRVIEPSRQVADSWRRETDSLREYTDETKRLYRAQEKFKLLNLSEGDNAKAFDAVKQVVKDVRGTNSADTTEILTDLFNALGNVDGATKSLPLATKYRANFEALYGDKFSKEQISEQIQNSFKFLEIQGATNKGQPEMESLFDTITKISNSTGGRVTGVDFLNMARRGKTATKNLTPQGLMNISSLIEETSADSVGASMMSLFQSLVGGVMKQSSAERFDYFGLVDKSKIEYNKAGRIKRLKPGANKLGDAVMEDPLKGADMLRDAMKAKGINTDDDKAVDKELAVLFQNRNAQALMSALINQRDQVVKESDRAKNAKGILGQDAQLSGTPLKQVQEYEAALMNFKANAGIPLLQTLGGLANTATPALKFFGEHQEVAKWAMATIVAGKGIKFVSETASILTTGGSGLMSFFKNSKSSADDATKSFNKTSDAIGNVSSKSSALKGALGNISRLGALLALGYTIDKAFESYTAAKEAEKGKNSAIGANTNTFNNAMADKDISQQEKQKITALEATTNFGKLNTYGLLRALGVEQGTTFSQKGGASDGYVDQLSMMPGAHKLLGMNNYRNIWGNFDRKLGVEKFRDDAPTLIKPDVMREFLKYLPERIPGNDAKSVNARDEIKKTAQQAFPDSFAQAMRELSGLSFSALTQSFADVQQPIPGLVGQLASLNDKSGSAVTGINSLATATSNAASRMNAAQFQSQILRIPAYGQNPAPNPLLNGIFGRAKGGSVKKGNAYEVGEVGKELFVPNQSGSIVSNDVLRKRVSDSKTSIVHQNNTFHITGKNADEIADRVLEKMEVLSARVSRIESDSTMDRLAQKVEYAAQRDSERL